MDGDDTPAAGHPGTARDEVQRLLTERAQIAISLAGGTAVAIIR